ncbi:Kinesin-like protein [Klebsormidium nitens]|uniref:Kinesin-like protein n=1 Tax=Klebsormidium nitens TaxID=105231 RepID=A0A1Y1IBQ2_KLENI|nr:Kinesin-like protein [Klebsormidium nitens]|eukprot:GAQ86136.1 Kinesin-like protein [Klebsormidium nitens]
MNRKELGSNDDEKVGEASFHFDRIFWPEASQKEVYTEVAEPIVKGAVSSYTGQSSKGHIAKAYEYLVKVSVVELYMEKLRDLLQTEKDNLSIRESAEKGIWIAEATEVFVQSELEMLQVLQAGVENRAVASTNMNNESSRSHCIYLISIIATHVEDRSVKTGKLHLVDLAGSEKVDKTGAEGQVLSEAKMINKSLSALGNVINALTDEFNPCNLGLHPDAPGDSAEISRLKAKVSLLEQHLLRMKNQILQELSNMGTIRLHEDGSYDQEGDLDRVYVALLEEIRSSDQGQDEDVGLSSLLPDGSKAIDGSDKHCGDSVCPSLQNRMERLAVSYAQALKQNARLTEEKRALERMVQLTRLNRSGHSSDREPRILRPKRGDCETPAPAKLDTSGLHDVHGLMLFRISPAAIWKHMGLGELVHTWAKWH